MSKQETWQLVYLVNYLFELHDVFVGSLVALRMVSYAKRILLQMLEDKQRKIN